MGSYRNANTDVLIACTLSQQTNASRDRLRDFITIGHLPASHQLLGKLQRQKMKMGITNQCCGSGSTRIGIIFPDTDRHQHPGPADQDLYPVKPNVKITILICGKFQYNVQNTSVADPDSHPDPKDPYVFGPPGSRSISQIYESGSFYHQAKIVGKNIDRSVL